MKTDQNSQISTSLVDLGLTESQSHVYYALLEMGHSTVLEVSKYTSVNRIKVHKTVEELVELGLVGSYTLKKRRRIFAESPEKLRNILKIQKEELDRKDIFLGDLINELYKSVSNIKDNTASEVKFYEGYKSIRDLYDSILESKSIWTIVNSNKVLKYFPENLDKFITKVQSGAEIFDLHVFGDSNENLSKLNSLYLNYNSKVLPAQFSSVSAIDYLLYDGHIAMILADTVPKAVVIKNQHFYLFALEMYKFIWKMC